MHSRALVGKVVTFGGAPLPGAVRLAGGEVRARLPELAATVRLSGRAPRAFSTGVIVIVYGYEGSGPGHWQRWLYGELQKRGVPVSFPELPDPSSPRCDVWVSELRSLVERAPGPVVFVAHSLGCWAVDHFLARWGARKIHAALLVAPPSPYLLFEPVQSFFPPPQSALAWQPIAHRSLLVGSDNDAYIDASELESIGQGLGLSVRVLPGAGHINIDAGYGPWPFALEWALSAQAAASREGTEAL
jgi:predicted alpha/beta hydrolase family esterase